MSVSLLEKKALTSAVMHFLCIDGDIDMKRCYKAYRQLQKCAADQSLELDDDIVVWQPFEDQPLSYVLEQIDSMAQALVHDYKDVLDAAKAGIIEQAINCQLDSDMNTLDMEALANAGFVIR